MSDEVDKCIPMFHLEVRKDDGASEREGRPVFRKVPYVEVVIKDMPQTRINRMVTDADKERWPVQWARFQARQENKENCSGTPLSELPGLPLEDRAALEFGGITTVDELVDISETKAESLGFDALRLRSMAKCYIDLARGMVKGKITDTLAELYSKIAALEDENKFLKEKIEKLEMEKQALLESSSATPQTQLEQAMELFSSTDLGPKEVAEKVGCSLATAYRARRELQDDNGNSI